MTRRQKGMTVRFNRRVETSYYPASNISSDGDRPCNKTSPIFHGFIPEETEDQQNSGLPNSAPIKRLPQKSNNSYESLAQPFETKQSTQNSQASNKIELIDHKNVQETKDRSKYTRYRQISESSTDTNMLYSPKSPIKMVFKKTSGSMTIVSPTFTSELATSSRRKGKTVNLHASEGPKLNMENNNNISQETSLVSQKKKPLRPIEAQTVINIGGYKYLVVPNISEKCHQLETKKLPFLLRPVEEEITSESLSTYAKPPTFEIEETINGQLILVPLNSEDLLNIPDSMKRNKDKKSEPLIKTTNQVNHKATKDSESFVNHISTGYHALLNVFSYLNPQELAKCRRVCKLWKNIAEHSSLWENVRLKNCHVSNWQSFAQHINGQGTKTLNLRGIIHLPLAEAKNNNVNKTYYHTVTWNEFAKAAPYFKNLERIEWPKVRISDLQKVMGELNKTAGLKLSEIVATSIVTTEVDSVDTNSSEEKSISIDIFTQVKTLTNLRIKAAHGNFYFRNLESDLKALVSNVCGTLTNLSILSIGSGINHKHLEIISELNNLTSLEIGDCTESFDTTNIQPAIPLSKLAHLDKLDHLRVEGGKIDRNIGVFETLNRLELINTELEQEFSEGLCRLQKLKSFLLIPCYKSDTAAINAEIFDSVLSMEKLRFLTLGFTNEGLKSLNSSLCSDIDVGKQTTHDNVTDIFPILINGYCEIFSLKKLSKTLKSALPTTELKILKMPISAACKQSAVRPK